MIFGPDLVRSADFGADQKADQIVVRIWSAARSVET
jgi:hypothetical protein